MSKTGTYFIEVFRELEENQVPMTYGELTRSTEPWPWRKLWEQTALTHENFNRFINKMVEEMDE